MTAYNPPNIRDLYNYYIPTTFTTDDIKMLSNTLSQDEYVYRTSASSGTAYYAFDRTNATQWLSSESYNAITGEYTGSTTTTTTSGSIAGEWLQIEFGFPFKLRYYTMTGLFQPTSPRVYTIAGSTNGTDWFVVESKTVGAATDEPVNTITANISPTAYYKYYRLIISGVYVDATQCGVFTLLYNGEQMDTMALNKLRFNPEDFYTGETEYNDPIIGSTFFATPLWGIDADTFEGYDISASSYSLNPYYAFDSKLAQSGWQTYNAPEYQVGPQIVPAKYPYNGRTGNYIGATTLYTTTIQDVGDVSGEWIQIKYPFPFKLLSLSYSISQFAFLTSMNVNPRVFYMVGSNDGTTWEYIGLYTVGAANQEALVRKITVSINATSYYTYYRMIITNLFKSDANVANAVISNLVLNGRRT